VPLSGAGQPVFYYDLGDPGCYLAAERVMSTLPEVPEWEPVLGSTITGEELLDRERIERAARLQGLQPVRWPAAWPPDTRAAMLAATYAKRIGRAVAFSLAAFRQTFAGGRDLGDQDTILIAAAACEMHPAAVLKGIALRSTVQALEAATQRALGARVTALPAIEACGHLFEGHTAVERAAAALRGAA
jgi:2-hydroxychromene-2-carboxylate isomerase